MVDRKRSPSNFTEVRFFEVLDLAGAVDVTAVLLEVVVGVAVDTAILVDETTMGAGGVTTVVYTIESKSVTNVRQPNYTLVCHERKYTYQRRSIQSHDS